jgi:hypothetical protein
MQFYVTFLDGSSEIVTTNNKNFILQDMRDIDTIEWTDEQVIYLEEVQTGKIYTFHPELY